MPSAQLLGESADERFGVMLQTKEPLRQLSNVGRCFFHDHNCARKRRD
jgi:hypothetical protein